MSDEYRDCIVPGPNKGQDYVVSRVRGYWRIYRYAASKPDSKGKVLRHPTGGYIVTTNTRDEAVEVAVGLDKSGN